MGGILVVAPHPDDEVLGAAGLIHRAHRRGRSVRVVFLTNGDSFVSALPSPDGDRTAALVELGTARQSEALRAAGALGLGERDVCFLGYPGAQLRELLQFHPGPEAPLRSPFTGCDRSPYERTFGAESTYCAEHVIRDLHRIVAAMEPAEIYVTHSLDIHPDHGAAGVFVAEALSRLASEAVPSVFGYLVHRRSWPHPPGHSPDQPLRPPPELDTGAWQWVDAPLSESQRAARHAALGCHQSQLRAMGGHLRSLLRANELFCAMPPPHVCGEVDDASDWRHVPPCYSVRAVPDTAQVRSVRVGHADDALACSVDLAVRDDYELHVFTVLVRSDGEMRPWAGRMSGRESTVELAVEAPRGWQRAYLMLELRVDGTVADSTGYLRLVPAGQ